MFMIDEEKEIIKLRARKGFVRMAVEAGADIVPCYHFGNSMLFRFGPKCLEPYARWGGIWLCWPDKHVVQGCLKASLYLW